jgi:hypothetical protein
MGCLEILPHKSVSAKDVIEDNVYLLEALYSSKVFTIENY